LTTLKNPKLTAGFFSEKQTESITRDTKQPLKSFTQEQQGQTGEFFLKSSCNKHRVKCPERCKASIRTLAFKITQQRIPQHIEVPPNAEAKRIISYFYSVLF
jgi:hypothetical protein